MRAFLSEPHALQLLGEHASTRQNYPDFGELAGLRVHLNRPAMLLDDDVVADGEAKSGAFAGGLGCKERIEDLFLHLGQNTRAVVADRDFYPITKVFGRGRKGRLVVAAVRLRAALRGRIEAI